MWDEKRLVKSKKHTIDKFMFLKLLKASVSFVFVTHTYPSRFCRHNFVTCTASEVSMVDKTVFGEITV